MDKDQPQGGGGRQPIKREACEDPPILESIMASECQESTEGNITSNPSTGIAGSASRHKRSKVRLNFGQQSEGIPGVRQGNQGQAMALPTQGWYPGIFSPTMTMESGGQKLGLEVIAPHAGRKATGATNIGFGTGSGVIGAQPVVQQGNFTAGVPLAGHRTPAMGVARGPPPYAMNPAPGLNPAANLLLQQEQLHREQLDALRTARQAQREKEQMKAKGYEFKIEITGLAEAMAAQTEMIRGCLENFEKSLIAINQQNHARTNELMLESTRFQAQQTRNGVRDDMQEASLRLSRISERNKRYWSKKSEEPKK